MVLYYCPMIRFSAAEIREIDKIWRGLPAEHSWSGWAVVGVEPSMIWLYRQRQNWRRFNLTKLEDTYSLTDDHGHEIGKSGNLSRVLCDIETVPSLGAEPRA